MKFTIFLTRDCNLRCKYCYEKNLSGGEYMNFITAGKIIEFIVNEIKINESKKLGRPLTIIFHGGEPLLNYKVMEYMCDIINSRISDIRVIYSFTTNGTIMNKKIIDFIVKNKIYVSVSIDGTKETNDKNRIFRNGKGSYDIVVGNIKTLLKNNINIRIRMTFTPSTVESIYENIIDMISIGVKDIVMIPDFQSEIWKEEHINIIETQINMLIDIKERFKDVDINLLDLKSLNTKKGHCYGGISGVAIDVNGDLYPCTVCVGNEEFKIGNALYESLADLDTHNLFSINYLDNRHCRECSRKEYCLTKRCKYINKVVTNDFSKTIPILCSMENIYLKTSNTLIKIDRGKTGE